MFESHMIVIYYFYLSYYFCSIYYERCHIFNIDQQFMLSLIERLVDLLTVLIILILLYN